MSAPITPKNEPKSTDFASSTATSVEPEITINPADSKSSHTDQPRQQSNSSRVTHWHPTSKKVDLKTFTGYEIKLDGWVRQDILSQRELQQHPVLEGSAYQEKGAHAATKAAVPPQNHTEPHADDLDNEGDSRAASDEE